MKIIIGSLSLPDEKSVEQFERSRSLLIRTDLGKATSFAGTMQQPLVSQSQRSHRWNLRSSYPEDEERARKSASTMTRAVAVLRLFLYLIHR